jgi:2-keto-4-pentenoate hydratase/2-oxohepta-3-ene-1,7-dioic acid hydratase in catechol pathway
MGSSFTASNIDWSNMILETRVNGETRQKQNTSDLIFDIPTLIETCSMGITLQPGDVIATGTPGTSSSLDLLSLERPLILPDFGPLAAGVGIGKSPPVYLKSGDLVEVEITGLGKLSNVVGSASAPAPACAPILPPDAGQPT